MSVCLCALCVICPCMYVQCVYVFVCNADCIAVVCVSVCDIICELSKCNMCCACLCLCTVSAQLSSCQECYASSLPCDSISKFVFQYLTVVSKSVCCISVHVVWQLFLIWFPFEEVSVLCVLKCTVWDLCVVSQCCGRWRHGLFESVCYVSVLWSVKVLFESVCCVSVLWSGEGTFCWVCVLCFSVWLSLCVQSFKWSGMEGILFESVCCVSVLWSA